MELNRCRHQKSRSVTMDAIRRSLKSSQRRAIRGKRERDGTTMTPRKKKKSKKDEIKEEEEKKEIPPKIEPKLDDVLYPKPITYDPQALLVPTVSKKSGN